MDTTKFAGVVAAGAVMFGIGTASPAAAESIQVAGSEATANQNGTQVAYTVSRIVPSSAPIAPPVGGQLYEATVMAKALQGTVIPAVPSFTARSASGASYPVRSDVSNLSTFPLLQGDTRKGQIYFDVVGEAPNSVVFNNGAGDVLTWVQAGQPLPGSEGEGGAPAGGEGGSSQGVPDETDEELGLPYLEGEAVDTDEGGEEDSG
ncbi:DUF1942 domain-containing protein [Mycobacterium sp. NPDC050551]|uniref:DUF1942 domain-containing protein n=1 Tax=Mycobacterium sp. NPDC050551 TaxID=3155407 RepID=UPI00341C84A5